LSVHVVISLISLVRHGIEMSFELVEPRFPQAPVRLDPLVDGAERFGADPIDAALGVGADVDEAGLSEDAQMLGDGGLADRELVDEVAHGPFRDPQQVEDAPPVRFCEYLER
jgi:hypothetical protein